VRDRVVPAPLVPVVAHEHGLAVPLAHEARLFSPMPLIELDQQATESRLEHPRHHENRRLHGRRGRWREWWEPPEEFEQRRAVLFGIRLGKYRQNAQIGVQQEGGEGRRLARDNAVQRGHLAVGIPEEADTDRSRLHALMVPGIVADAEEGVIGIVEDGVLRIDQLQEACRRRHGGRSEETQHDVAAACRRKAELRIVGSGRGEPRCGIPRCELSHRTSPIRRAGRCCRPSYTQAMRIGQPADLCETPGKITVDAPSGGDMLRGLMQDWPLLVPRILDHAAQWHGEREIVSRRIEGDTHRYTYRDLHSRARRLAKVLLGLGLKPGDRVGTFAWNTHRHLEVYYATAGTGTVCHTINPRLFADQIAYIINHAEDRIIFADINTLPILDDLAERIPGVEAVIVMTDRDHMPAATRLKRILCFEDLMEQADDDFRWATFDERAALALCYTSGTTGNPKGVLYSHRSTFLHAIVVNGADALGLTSADTVLVVVPMFHANAW